jgi:hypothetical protein
MSSDWTPRAGERLGDSLPGQLLGRSVHAARNLAAVQNGWPQEVAVCVLHAQDEEARAAQAPAAVQPSTGAGPTA